MPRQKDLKQLVRARMKKTGEAYTAARGNLVKKAAAKAELRTGTPSATPPAPKPTDYAALAGTSDTALKQKTGRTWKGWVQVLDSHAAATMTHRDIARLVHAEYEVDDWWSQAVTVGYERIKGLRAHGQRRDGTFETSKSRTYHVPVSTLFAAWADARIRRRWLGGAKVRVRTATAPKSMRLDWNERGIIAVGFTAKGPGKSAVAVQHTKLPDRATADQLKEYWAERLDALGQVLAEGRKRL
jgi:hypothetical protein